MNAWMQLHDYSHVDLPDGSFGMAIKALREFDWEAEIQKEEELSLSGGDGCPPGIGFNSEDERTLHLMPNRDQTASVFYSYTTKKKLLGLLPVTTSPTVSAGGVPEKDWDDMIRHHYDGCHDKVMRMLEPYHE